MPVLSHVLQQQSIGRFSFEDGTSIDDVTLTYAITHPVAQSDGLVIVCPSLTGTPSIQQAWWADVGAPAAHARYRTLYPHAFSPETLAHFDRLTPPTIRDIARGIVALTKALGLPPATFVTGGSMGGMLALEVALECGAPTHALVLAAPAVQTAWGAGWNLIQLHALELGGDVAGLSLARAVGMMTYRTEREFESRFGSDVPAADGRTMTGYLQHHGRALIARFDAREYERRVRAMDTHDVGRDRGGWRAAIAPHADRITAVGVRGDALYSAGIVEAWAQECGATFVAVDSIHGHDAFILERDQMRAVIDAAFARAAMVPSVR
jgi:homoserine O-acetyltransferase/O-succinyltransferase